MVLLPTFFFRVMPMRTELDEIKTELIRVKAQVEILQNEVETLNIFVIWPPAEALPETLW